MHAGGDLQGIASVIVGDVVDDGRSEDLDPVGFIRVGAGAVGKAEAVSLVGAQFPRIEVQRVVSRCVDADPVFPFDPGGKLRNRGFLVRCRIRIGGPILFVGAERDHFAQGDDRPVADDDVPFNDQDVVHLFDVGLERIGAAGGQHQGGQGKKQQVYRLFHQNFRLRLMYGIWVAKTEIM